MSDFAATGSQSMVEYKKRAVMSVMKNIANLLTASRFLFTVGMTLTAPFSAAFWVCYLACGISDQLDGAVARRRIFRARSAQSWTASQISPLLRQLLWWLCEIFSFPRGSGSVPGALRRCGLRAMSGVAFLVRGGACNYCEISHAEPGPQRAVSNKTQFGVKKES